MKSFYLFYASNQIATDKVYRAIKKYLLLFLLTIFGVINAFCQQDPRSSLYMQNITSFNPGAVGSNPQGDFVIDDKEPYGQFKDGAGNKIAPNTIWTNFNMPLNKINSGIGLNINVDKNGLFESSTNLALQYAYQLKIGDGKLGLGTNLGFNKIGYDFSKAVYPSNIAGASSGTDQIIENLKSKKSYNIFNLGLGGYYKRGNLYFGASVSNLNSPKINTVKYFVPNVYFLAGYTYNPTNPLFVIMPSMQYKSPINGMVTLTIPQLSLSTIVEYSKFLLIGMEYSTGAEVSVLAGANIKNGSKFDGWRFLFAYDIIASKLGALNGSKIEFMIGYSFNLHIEKTTKTYKSVRFL